MVYVLVKWHYACHALEADMCDLAAMCNVVPRCLAHNLKQTAQP